MYSVHGRVSVVTENGEVCWHKHNAFYGHSRGVARACILACAAPKPGDTHPRIVFAKAEAKEGWISAV